MDQPDNFEPHPQKDHIRQTRPILTSQNNNCQSQTPVSTQSYQPTKCKLKSHYHIIYNTMK